MGKVKLAMHAAAGCGGCDVSVLDLHERILEVAGAAELLFWPMFCDGSVKDLEEYPDRHLDASLFNGAIRNSEDEHMARLLRQKSRVLVAFGSCAHLGGIPGLANLNSLEELLRVV
ncbi:MAG TPA: F420-nonreducing hydrogenase, partial [Anaeromyxobacteraceae bacterium]|nr:F420-nonreducing hydrogenase [Anaeromyxobacteraceae bacterium]